MHTPTSAFLVAFRKCVGGPWGMGVGRQGRGWQQGDTMTGRSKHLIRKFWIVSVPALCATALPMLGAGLLGLDGMHVEMFGVRNCLPQYSAYLLMLYYTDKPSQLLNMRAALWA